VSSVLSARPRAVRALAASTAVAAAVATAVSCSPPPSSPQTIAKNTMYFYGWGNNQQFSCLNNLWMRESGWRVNAANPYSGAYGIPQALPGSKMAASGPQWRTDAGTQIRWGLNYIRARYGSPCGAWSHSLATGWY
jgi:hypothetical protein